MPRLVPAAQQLIEQVTALRKSAKASPAAEPDGIGRIRVIEFDARTSTWLAPVLEAVRDDRIAALEFHGKRLAVHFVSTTRADHRDPYPLAEVKAVLDETS